VLFFKYNFLWLNPEFGEALHPEQMRIVIRIYIMSLLTTPAAVVQLLRIWVGILERETQILKRIHFPRISRI
jgi:hypothetical protein